MFPVFLPSNFNAKFAAQRHSHDDQMFAWSMKDEDMAAETADKYGLIPIPWLSLAVRIQLILHMVQKVIRLVLGPSHRKENHAD